LDFVYYYNMENQPELLLIDKPAGITSMDVIRRLRKKLQIRKIGHAGTLDPLATGLMLVGVGPGTKKLNELIKLDKEYVAEVRLGESRTTGDLEGEVIAHVDASTVIEDEVVRQLETLVGVQRLPVSAYSAIKKDGVPMYKRARKAEKTGETVTEVPIRDMEVKEVELLSFTTGKRAVATVRFLVGSGTYIRSLGEELGRRLGYPAVLQSLRRTQVGEYRIEDALTL
jgi:tRNA pseudouridine55 synthase